MKTAVTDGIGRFQKNLNSTPALVCKMHAVRFQSVDFIEITGTRSGDRQHESEKHRVFPSVAKVHAGMVWIAYRRYNLIRLRPNICTPPEQGVLQATYKAKQR
jgi:hypothetical protein